MEQSEVETDVPYLHLLPRQHRISETRRGESLHGLRADDIRASVDIAGQVIEIGHAVIAGHAESGP